MNQSQLICTYRNPIDKELIHCKCGSKLMDYGKYKYQMHLKTKKHERLIKALITTGNQVDLNDDIYTMLGAMDRYYRFTTTPKYYFPGEFIAE